MIDKETMKKEREDTELSQQNIYDDPVFFENFKSLREDEVNFNDLIETPIITAMLPDLSGMRVLDIGCGMGQHAAQYARAGASAVVAIDISERMLAYARENNSAGNICYRRLPFEELEQLDGPFDVVTSSLAFDYVEDLGELMGKIHAILANDGVLVFSISHPIATAHDGTYDRFMRAPSGERLYANLRNYAIEGERHTRWVVEDCEYYHRTVSTLINEVIQAGFAIEECQESKVSEDMLESYPGRFDGEIHQPSFIFFRCGRRERRSHGGGR